MPRQVWFKTAYVDVNTGTVTRELNINGERYLNVNGSYTISMALPCILSTSSSHRWRNCTSSARLERGFADRETFALCCVRRP